MPNIRYERNYLSRESILTFRLYNLIKAIRCSLNIIRKSEKTTQIPVYLTSYGCNIKNITPVIRSLNDQKYRARDVNLVVSEGDYLKYEAFLTRLKLKEGIKVHVTKDYKSHKKYFIAVKNEDYPFITVDDDVIYPSDLVKNFYIENKRYPNDILTNQARLMVRGASGFEPYSNFNKIKNISSLCLEAGTELLQIGAYGVFYPKGSLSKEVVNIAKAMELTETGDDLWLKVQSRMNGVNVRLIRERYIPFAKLLFRGKKERPLHLDNVSGGKNNIMLENLLKEYKIV